MEVNNFCYFFFFRKSLQLAKMMDGKIGAQSEEGVGSTFWFTARFERVPDRQAEEEAMDNKVQKALDAGDGAPLPDNVRILLVEDNTVNGREAIHALQTASYDLVLMDCLMPEMDGFEATRAIRQREAAAKIPSIPIIAMTASAMRANRERCFQSGMNDFLAKPVQSEELAEMLARWLARSRYGPEESEAGRT